MLWFCEGHASLSDAAKDAIQNQDNERFVSLATAWEVAIKISLGKLQLGIDFDVLFFDVPAEIERLQIVTGDPHFAKYEVPVLW